MATRRVTSGLLPVPSGPEGLGHSVHILISNFAATVAEVPLQVNRLDVGNVKVQLRSEAVTVGAGGATRIILGELGAQVIEVNLELPSSAVKPSVAIVTTAQASDTSDLTEWVSPDAFAELPSGTSDAVATMHLTTGLFPVDISGNDFTPPFEYTVNLYISNFTDAPADIGYTLNWARELFGAKVPLEQASLTVEPGTGGAVTLEGVAGRLVEVNLESIPPGFVPTIAVVRTNPEAGSMELLRWIAATEFARLRIPASQS